MDKLTKNHLKIAVLVSAVLMLITWFAFPVIDVLGKIKFSLLDFISNSELRPDFFWCIIIFLLLLAPVYVGLAVMKENEALEKLKPIFDYDKRILFSIPLILIVVFILYISSQNGCSLAFGSYLYLLASIVVCATAFIKPVDGDSEGK